MDAVNEPSPTGLSVPERVLVSLAIAGLFAMAALITINVISRWIGRSIIPDDVLLVQELMVPVILLPLGIVTALRQHISVELFTEKVPLAGQRVLAVLAHLVGLAFGGILLWAALRGFASSWSTQDYHNGVLHIPMWLGQGVFVFGIGLFVLRLLMLLSSDLRDILRQGGARSR